MAHAIRLGIKPFAELGGQLGGIERVPSRFSLFLPSDLRIGPASDATVSIQIKISERQALWQILDSRFGFRQSVM